jgi:hypothetical protein
LVTLRPLHAVNESFQTTLDSLNNTAVISIDEQFSDEPEVNLTENTTVSLLDAKIPQEDASRNPRVFVCGFDLWNLRNQLFGDLEFAGRFGEATSITSLETDILLQGGLNGPCSTSPDGSFPGKILFVHSEARKGGDAEKHLWNDRFFKLGPSEDSPSTSERSMPGILFGAIVFVSATTAEQRQWILDPTKKRKVVDPRPAIIYVVNRCGTFRNEAALELSKAAGLEIHQNPKCPKRNDKFLAIPNEDWTTRDLYKENWRLYSKYKYCLVIENTDTADYITEKLFMAFLGGCLPIYWGTMDVWNLFNRRAFVFYDMDNPSEALEEIKYLEANETAYKEKLDQQILAHGQATIEKYLSLADDVGKGSLKHQIRAMLGIEQVS